jgi:hypothetical protein
MATTAKAIPTTTTTGATTTTPPTTPYLQHLMLDVKNMRVKHVRKMFVLLREIGTDLHLSDMEHKTDWAEYTELNNRLQTLVVQHGLTLGEFATGYVLNIQARQRVVVPEVEKKVETKPTPTTTTTTSRKRKAPPPSSAPDGAVPKRPNTAATKNKKK